MKVSHLHWLLLAISTAHTSLWSHKIGLCIMATGKYDALAQNFIESARKFFCKNHEVTYFVFTDGKVRPASDIVQVYQKRLGWPLDTLMRFEVYATHAKLLACMDYIFASDADMRFVAPVGDEILSDRVATQHPGYAGYNLPWGGTQRGEYETNPISTAYVSHKEGKCYFAGGFYGGQRDEFFTLIEHLTIQIRKDFDKNHIARWHDESHLNRYFIDNKPTLILSPSYCYPENWNLPCERKLLALDKNHAAMRK